MLHSNYGPICHHFCATRASKVLKIASGQNAPKILIEGKKIFWLEMTQNTLKCKNQQKIFLDFSAILDFSATKNYTGLPYTGINSP